MNDVRFQKGNRTASSLLPMAAMLGAVVSQSVGASFAKELIPIIGPTGTVALRVAGAAIILGLIGRPWRTKLSREDWRSVALYGTTIGVMNLLFYQALRVLPLGIATSIEFSGPLAVALASSRRALDFGWIGLATLGLLSLLPTHAGATALDPAGVAFALGAAVCWGLYIIFGKRLGHMHGGQSVASGLAIASLFTVPLGLLSSGAALLKPSTLLAGFGVAALSSAVPFSLEMIALKRLPKQAFGVMLSLDPAFVATAAFFILGERLTLVQWAAVASIMAASIGMSLTAKQDVLKPDSVDAAGLS